MLTNEELAGTLYFLVLSVLNEMDKDKPDFEFLGKSGVLIGQFCTNLTNDMKKKGNI